MGQQGGVMTRLEMFVVKVHKIENFFGSDFEFVLFHCFLIGPLMGEMRLFRLV
jgi:hypothetical protein